MSDESPKLRLKPRLTADAPAPSAASAPPTPPAAAEAPVAATAAPVAPASPAPVVAAPAEPPAETNPLGAPMPPIGAPPTFKLKPKAPTAPTVAPAPPAPPPPPAPIPAAPPPVAQAAPPPIPPAVPKPAGLKASDITIIPGVVPLDPAVATAEKAAATAKANQKLKRVAILIGAAGVLVFAGVGYVAYGKLKHAKATLEKLNEDPNPPRKKKDAAKTKTAPQAETPASVPEPAVPAPVATAPAETPPPPTPQPAPTPVAPAATPAAPVPAGPVEPSAMFVNWVNALKITGVRTGNAPRVLIERATFGVGDTVNHDLGITFDGYDASRRMLRFKDKTGATVERRDRQ